MIGSHCSFLDRAATAITTTLMQSTRYHSYVLRPCFHFQLLPRASCLGAVATPNSPNLGLFDSQSVQTHPNVGCCDLPQQAQAEAAIRQEEVEEHQFGSAEQKDDIDTEGLRPEAAWMIQHIETSSVIVQIGAIVQPDKVVVFDGMHGAVCPPPIDTVQDCLEHIGWTQSWFIPRIIGVSLRAPFALAMLSKKLDVFCVPYQFRKSLDILSNYGVCLS